MLASIVMGFIFWCIYFTIYVMFCISTKRHIDTFEAVLTLLVSLTSGAIWGFTFINLFAP